MPDPRFAQTVIFMLSHSDEGAMGVIVNRPAGEIPYDVLLTEMCVDADGAQGGVMAHYGGPVETERGFVLHSTDVVDPGSVVVSDTLAMTTRSAFLKRIADGDAPEQFLFMLGYAGWAPEQLDSELARGGWSVVPFDRALVFSDTPESSWQRAMSTQGVDL